MHDKSLNYQNLQSAKLGWFNLIFISAVLKMDTEMNSSMMHDANYQTVYVPDLF